MRSVALAALAGTLMLSAPALAAGHGGGGGGGHFGGGHFGGGHFGGGHFGGGFRGRGSVFIGGGFGFSPWWGGYGYGYPYWPGYYYPPPVVYAPPVAYAPAAAPVAAAPTYDQSYCRDYQSTAVIEGVSRKTHGVACRQPDGTWRIVQ